MNKYIFKQCLNAIDRLEIEGLTPAELKEAMYKRLQDKIHHLTFSDIEELIDTLLYRNMIVKFDNITDLSVPLTVFARAPHNSMSEALAFFESMFQDSMNYEFFMSRLNSYFTKQDIAKMFRYNRCFEEIVFEIQLFDENGGRYFVKPDIKTLLLDREIENNSPYLVSSITLAYFIKDVTRLQNIPFRNQSLPIVHYRNWKIIMQAVPYRGIPEKRDASESLQSFFKDCLFHEYQHRCEICGISIPQMLIASHIKPFRDCGHLIEAADYNNGILLCKNHDFLFDQGYITFQSNGQINISPELSRNDYAKFQIRPDFFLQEKLLTPMRQQFLEYHRINYFKY